MSSHDRSRCRGFAMIIVVAIIGLIGVTLLGLVSLLRADISRTRSAAEQAQTRQLLLAGGRIIQTSSKQWPADVQSSSEAVSIPSQLFLEKSSLLVAIRPQAQAVNVELLAAGENTIARQSLTYRRSGNEWKLHRAEIE